MLLNLFKFLYFTYLHNYDLLGFAVSALISLIVLIKKPNRRRVFFFVGFLILALHFEYEKHIVKDLAEQTADVLFADVTHFRAQWLTDIFLRHLFPLGLWLLGWSGVILGIVNPSRLKFNPPIKDTPKSQRFKSSR
jgi:hypothetical protein